MLPRSRRSFLFAAIAAAGCTRGDQRRSKAARYLWSQQADDGGWHSHTYGLLRSGQSLTPFVLDALLDTPEVDTGAVERAVEFIKRNTNSDGSLGLMDSVAPDYPNYATGLALSALTKAKAKGCEPMVACMRNQQFTESNRWTRADAPYGAWGMGGDRRRPPDAGHVDLAMTRYVLEGLAAAGVRPPDPALRVRKCISTAARIPTAAFSFQPSKPVSTKPARMLENSAAMGQQRQMEFSPCAPVAWPNLIPNGSREKLAPRASLVRSGSRLRWRTSRNLGSGPALLLRRRHHARDARVVSVASAAAPRRELRELQQSGKGRRSPNRNCVRSARSFETRVKRYNSRSMPIDWFPLWLSLRVAVLSTAVALAAGLWIAYILANREFRYKEAAGCGRHSAAGSAAHRARILSVGAAGRASPFGQSVGKDLRVAAGVHLESRSDRRALHSFPLLVKSARAALESVDRS